MKQSRSTEEARLIRSAARGNDEAAAILFQRHWTYVWRMAYRLLGHRADADDCAQEAFAAAFANLESFEQRSSFRTWVTRIAINRGLNALRADKARSVSWLEAFPTDGEIDLAASQLLDALGRLPADRRSVVVMRYWLGYSIEEISEFLHIPSGTVNSRLARALRAMRSYLEVANVR